MKTNLFRKLEKYKEIINNEIENLYILNNEKKEAEKQIKKIAALQFDQNKNRIEMKEAANG